MLKEIIELNENNENYVEEYIFKMLVNKDEMYIGLRDILQCLYLAEELSIIPKLPDKWWSDINCRYV